MGNADKNLYLKAAKYYDYDIRDNMKSDIPFYIDYARKAGVNILELGCGTGRVSLPLAEAGYHITGLDLSASMLEVFNKKLENISEEVKSNIKLVNDNMSSFSLEAKYNLIIAPFRAFQSLSEEGDINNCLKCVYKHLLDNGIFIVNVFRPNKVLDESWCYPEIVQWETEDAEKNLRIVKKHRGSKIDVVKQVIYVGYAYEVTDAKGVAERIEEKLSLRYYYYPQLKGYLKDNGFEVLEEFGWYDRSNIESGRELIFVCRKR